MAWTIIIQPDAERDLALISDFLFQSYTDFGEHPEDAFGLVEKRIQAITSAARSLATNPHRGTKRDEFGPNVRNVTIEKAIIWFQVDENTETIDVLAFFYGGQNHLDHMLERLLSK